MSRSGRNVDFKNCVVRQTYKRLYGAVAGGLIKKRNISIKRNEGLFKSFLKVQVKWEKFWT